MSADHRSPAATSCRLPALSVAGYMLPALSVAGYTLPGLAGADHAMPPLAGVSARLRRLLRIEDRTANRLGCALTFDDGPHPLGTPAVLEILAAKGVQATFFLVGERVRANPSLVGEILAAGHTIGLHCDRHRNLLRLAPWQVREDIARAEESILAAAGTAATTVTTTTTLAATAATTAATATATAATAAATAAHPITLYRPPYGIANAAALAIARRRGWRTLLWSHWGRDWESQATPDSIATLLTAGVGEGSVLLLHDADDYSAEGSWRNTVAALPRVLDELQQRELTFTAP